MDLWNTGWKDYSLGCKTEPSLTEVSVVADRRCVLGQGLWFVLSCDELTDSAIELCIKKATEESLALLTARNSSVLWRTKWRSFRIWASLHVCFGKHAWCGCGGFWFARRTLEPSALILHWALCHCSVCSSLCEAYIESQCPAMGNSLPSPMANYCSKVPGFSYWSFMRVEARWLGLYADQTKIVARVGN